MKPVLNTSAVRCHLAIIREDDGTFSAVVLNLPGAGSCGETEEEAIANAKEAVAGLIESYKDDHEQVPWIEPSSYTFRGVQSRSGSK